MRSATSITVSAFGVVAGLAGIEHGIGEVLQGNTAPAGIVIQSWPESELFAILHGEPAMTILPNLLITGLLAILFSLLFMVWSTVFIERKHGGLVLILLSIILLLVGGGFGPPLLGIMLGLTATRIHTPLDGWRTHLSSGTRRRLGKWWPGFLGAGLVAWLLLMPVTMLLDHFFVIENPGLLVGGFFFSAMGLLLLTIVTALARDSAYQASKQASHHASPAMRDRPVSQAGS